MRVFYSPHKTLWCVMDLLGWMLSKRHHQDLLCVYFCWFLLFRRWQAWSSTTAREEQQEPTSSLWDLWVDAWSSGQASKYCIMRTAVDDNSNSRIMSDPRFDVGSGMATIRDPHPIKLGEFHTVELYRNLTQGYITVDGGEPISGKSQVIYYQR